MSSRGRKKLKQRMQFLTKEDMLTIVGKNLSMFRDFLYFVQGKDSSVYDVYGIELPNTYEEGDEEAGFAALMMTVFFSIKQRDCTNEICELNFSEKDLPELFKVGAALYNAFSFIDMGVARFSDEKDKYGLPTNLVVDVRKSIAYAKKHNLTDIMDKYKGVIDFDAIEED